MLYGLWINPSICLIVDVLHLFCQQYQSEIYLFFFSNLAFEPLTKFCWAMLCFSLVLLGMLFLY
jgi:hypothetical protein